MPPQLKHKLNLICNRFQTAPRVLNRLRLFTLKQSPARRGTAAGWRGLVPVRAQRLRAGLALGEVSQLGTRQVSP